MDYDCVLMLTWSDWKTEARSNRYHYASRFAESVPVFFCQPLVSDNSTYRIERTELPNVDIVHTPIPKNELTTPVAEYHPTCSRESIEDIKSLLRSRGLSSPLIWIYNTANYFETIQAFPNSLRVLHATEDYFTHAKGIFEQNMGGETTKRNLQKTLDITDLLIAVSQGVLDGIEKNTDYCGKRIVLENGVDTKFFLNLASEKQKETTPGKTKPQKRIAIYQGGINNRLDYELLETVIKKMPDWDFWFCGAEQNRNEEKEAIWKALLKKKNVSWFGDLPPEEFGAHMLASSVGIIPFVQNEWIKGSAPLKSFEYLACDLPVVSVPIDSLENYPDHFKLAETAEEFIAGIRSSLKLKNDRSSQEARKKLCEERSYDHIFKSANENISDLVKDFRSSEKELNTLILYDENSTHVNTIEEHLLSFKKYSKNNIFYLPATGNYPLENLDPDTVYNLDVFDVIIIHYSVRLSLRDHLNSDLVDLLARHSGIKVLFIQDEYDTPEIARQWIERLNINMVYTCVRPEDTEYVYPKYRFQTTEFLQTLTGYIPENIPSSLQIPDIAKRKLRIGYRGRKLPFIYGSLGNEKYEIGLKVKEYAEEKGIPVDIEIDDSKRIYGDGWYSFLGSARATLGTESGSNVFDNDGTVAQEIDFMLNENPEVAFDEVFTSVLAKHEERITMNQISPKIFESILFRTALVLFEGEYSGVVQPEKHYIPLKKDFSNIDSVFEKLEDLKYLEQITSRAYSDVIDSGLYSYQSFVEGIDADLDARLLRDKKYDLFQYPAIAKDSKGEFKQLLPLNNLGLTLSTGIFPRGFDRTQISVTEAAQAAAEAAAEAAQVAAEEAQAIIDQANAERAGAEAALAQTQATLDQANAERARAEAALAQTQAEKELALAQAESERAQTQASLAQAEKELALAHAKAERAQAEATLAQTQAAEGAVQATLDQANAERAGAEAALAQAQVQIEKELALVQAESERAQAEATLAQIQAESERAQAEASLAQAESERAQAEATLAQIQAAEGAEPETILNIAEGAEPETILNIAEVKISPFRDGHFLAYKIARRIWRFIPKNSRYKIIAYLKKIKSPDRKLGIPMKIVLKSWRLMPRNLRRRIKRVIR